MVGRHNFCRSFFLPLFFSFFLFLFFKGGIYIEGNNGLAVFGLAVNESNTSPLWKVLIRRRRKHNPYVFVSVVCAAAQHRSLYGVNKVTCRFLFKCCQGPTLSCLLILSSLPLLWLFPLSPPVHPPISSSVFTVAKPLVLCLKAVHEL